MGAADYRGSAALRRHLKDPSHVHPAYRLERQGAEIQSLNDIAKNDPYFFNRADDPLSSSLVELCTYIGDGQAKALRKLKHPSRSRKLRSFLDN